MSAKEPIFIHCFPRVGSTWFGSKFMEKLGDSYFYEPMHEIMIDGTQEDADQEFDRLRQGKSLRHPSGIPPYFHNYPFSKEGGVPGFLQRFCYENYVLPPEQEDPEFKAYWASLIEYARTLGDQPGFKDTQSALRQGWMKANFGGVHIYLVQHPRLTDKSYHSFRGFNNRYIREFALTIGKNKNHPAFSEIFKWAAIEPPPEAQSYEQDIKHYSRLFSAPMEKRDPKFTRQYHYNAFCFFWMMGLAHASRYADIIVDMEALHDDDKRQEIERQIKEKTRLDIDLSDYKPKIPKKTIGEENFQLSGDIATIIARALPHVNPDWERIQGFPLSKTTTQAVESFARREKIQPDLFAKLPS